MFIIWYSLISFLYWIILTFNFIFKTLKLNNKFFLILMAYLNSKLTYINSVSKLNTTTQANNINTTANFKNLYQDYKFLSKKNSSLHLLKNFLKFTSLNKNLTSLNQNLSEINLLLTLLVFKVKSTNFKKVNLNFLTSNNFTYLPLSKYKLNYKSLKRNIKYSITLLAKVSNDLENSITKLWLIKYSPSNFIKYISQTNINVYNILYLRKNKVFNKGRYSRNRQYYRTGVYWCLYVNIVAVVGIYFWFYRFTMNFGYLWWLLFIFISSFIVPKTIKYRLYNPLNLLKSLYKDLLWISYILNNLKSLIKHLIKNLIKLNNSSASLIKFFIGLQNNKVYTTIIAILAQHNIIFINKNIYLWEYNNVNYYYNSIIKSRPIFFERIKLNLIQLVSFSFTFK